MKHIIKKQEPNSLTQYRSSPNAAFDSCNKEDIRLFLIEEQGAICAYCMQRISAKWNSKLNKYFTEIEHYKSQDVYKGENGFPDLRLNYNNMLGVCNGNTGQPKHKQHCDKSKDFKENKKFLPLTINPQNENCENLLWFSGSGKIKSENKVIDTDINIILNLNENGLVRARKKAIHLAISSINSNCKKHGKKDWSISEIKNERKKWATLYKSGFLPFCQAVISYLDRKIERYQKQY